MPFNPHQCHMKFNNVEYDAQSVANVGGTGPSVELTLTDINLTVQPALKQPMLVKQPLFFKFEGKYVVLLGHEHVQQAIVDKKTKIKGKLISTPMLKKARVEHNQPQVKHYEDEFANRPRFAQASDRPRQDRGPGGYSDNRGRRDRPNPSPRFQNNG